MDRDLVGGALSSIAILLSLLALLLNLRTARRQRLADSPLLTLEPGPCAHTVTIQNRGRSTALHVAASTTRGSFIRWADQFDAALRRQDCTTGELVGGEKPWTPDCANETRTLGPEERVVLVLSDARSRSEILKLSYRDYTGRRTVSRLPLS